MNKDAEEIISKLSLIEHPEGGYFREIYRSNEMIPQNDLPERYDGERCFATSIYFLLCDDQCSKLHRIKSDEIWHHYRGCCVKIYTINSRGEMSMHLLGSKLENGELPQIIIKHGNWFGAELSEKNSYSLIGCSVSPGFEFNDFELGNKDDLIEILPQHKDVINRLT